MGLRPAEAIELGLPAESVDITSYPSFGLTESTSNDEREWLLGEDLREKRGHYKKSRKILYRGTRVELNAFTPSEFIAWVEGKLESLAGKVVPHRKYIAEEAIKQYRDRLTKNVSEILLSRFDLNKFIEGLPVFKPPTAKSIKAELDENPERGWRDIIADAVREEMKRINLDERI